MRGRSIAISSITAPCNGCAERYMRCHAECLKYQDYAQKKAAEYEQNKKRMEANAIKFDGEARRFKNFGTSKSSIRHGKGMRGK